MDFSEVVLIIEDSITEAKVIAKIAESRGAICYQADNFQDALSVCTAIKVTCITIDINLGEGVNGLGIVRKLRDAFAVEVASNKFQFLIHLRTFAPRHSRSLLCLKTVKYVSGIICKLCLNKYKRT